VRIRGGDASCGCEEVVVARRGWFKAMGGAKHPTLNSQFRCAERIGHATI
jgi:hypothetical protein